MASKNVTLFAKLSLDYADHPKIQALSDAAFRAHVEMILYARRYLTDGRIPNRIANRFGSDAVTELMSNDEARPSLWRDEANDYWLYGFADIQETKYEVEARRLVAAANGAKGGRPAKPKVTQPVTQPVSKRATQTKAETETETETDNSLLRREGALPSAELAVPSSTADAAPTNKKGTRIPNNWQPTRNDANHKAEHGHDTAWLELEHARFCDYWKGVAGTKGAKLDWDATWRNWIRRAHQYEPTKQATTGASLNATDWDRMMADAKARDERTTP